MALAFKGSHLKINRANEHIQELALCIRDFLKTDFKCFVIEKDPDNEYNLLKFEITNRLPECVPLIIGDAIHNLRTALDLLTVELILLAKGIPGKYAKFPFMQNREELIGTINGGPLKAVGLTIIDLIVNTIKPYRGGDDLLFALHDMDIMDKHHMIIPTICATCSSGLSMINDRMAFIGNTLSILEGQSIVIGPIRTQLDITDYGNFSFDILFAEGKALGCQSVIPTLHQLSQLVSGIVDIMTEAIKTLA